jgi:hypothetical protein
MDDARWVPTVDARDWNGPNGWQLEWAGHPPDGFDGPIACVFWWPSGGRWLAKVYYPWPTAMEPGGYTSREAAQIACEAQMGANMAADARRRIGGG